MIIAISITLFFIVLRFTVCLFNFISNPKLTRVNRLYHDRVSILIPARNEEDNILTLLKSIQQQDYRSYEVIIYDDCSTDNTFKLSSEFASAHSNFRVIKGGNLPAGWTGKNHACHHLAKQATGRYFLFLDADTRVSNSLINSAVHRMQLYKLALLSIFANQEMITAGEKATVPLLHYLLLDLLPLRLVYLVKSPVISVACGQFMLFDAAIYRQKQWHKMVKNKIAEDAWIMKTLKSFACNGEVLLANGMLKCRMYKNLTEALNGFGKNSLALFNYNIPGALLFVLIIFSGPILVITTLNLNLIFFMAGLIALTRAMTSLLAQEDVWFNIIMHPIQIINMVAILFLSIQKHLTKSNLWKGRRLEGEGL